LHAICIDQQKRIPELAPLALSHQQMFDLSGILDVGGGFPGFLFLFSVSLFGFELV
jgi:hypothetical protein